MCARFGRTRKFVKPDTCFDIGKTKLIRSICTCSFLLTKRKDFQRVAVATHQYKIEINPQHTIQ
jgi:hypothetical protein